MGLTTRSKRLFLPHIAQKMAMFFILPRDLANRWAWKIVLRNGIEGRQQLKVCITSLYRQRKKKTFFPLIFFGFVCFWKKKKNGFSNSKIFMHQLHSNQQQHCNKVFFQNWEIYFEKFWNFFESEFSKIELTQKKKKKILGFCLFLRQKKKKWWIWWIFFEENRKNRKPKQIFMHQLPLTLSPFFVWDRLVPWNRFLAFFFLLQKSSLLNKIFFKTIRFEYEEFESSTYLIISWKVVFEFEFELMVSLWYSVCWDQTLKMALFDWKSL